MKSPYCNSDIILKQCLAPMAEWLIFTTRLLSEILSDI